MVLWQAVALAAVLAALGSGLSLVTDHAWRRGAGPVSLVVAAAALVVTAVVAGRLLLSGHRVGTSLRALRRRHREQVDLLAERESGVHVLDHAVPVAYCLPGMAHSRVVVSAAAMATLEPPQLAAVLAHERAHLRGPPRPGPRGVHRCCTRRSRLGLQRRGARARSGCWSRCWPTGPRCGWDGPKTSAVRC